MKDPVDLVLCEPAPFLFGVNGHFTVTDGSSVWIVVVTCEAMRATASPPEASLSRLVQFADNYLDMAERALSRGEDQDGKIWIFERHVLSRPGGAHLAHVRLTDLRSI
ncbi:hypothetical protein [Pseudorhizobium marinum]|uniref:hypothetical protein n=1 Tax=Pseudorhizobium marinum TaxID=1496690 RepID=UPI00049799C7|nr:hypothetical protein [Pseudorhizobium marinum]